MQQHLWMTTRFFSSWKRSVNPAQRMPSLLDKTVLFLHLWLISLNYVQQATTCVYPFKPMWSKNLSKADTRFFAHNKHLRQACDLWHFGRLIGLGNWPYIFPLRSQDKGWFTSSTNFHMTTSLAWQDLSIMLVCWVPVSTKNKKNQTNPLHQ